VRTTLLMMVYISGAVAAGGCAGFSGRPASDVMIIAHRGASEAAPENTIASAVLAWENGTDAVEVDIHLSRDNRLMVIHDETTKKTAGVDLKVSETDSAELRELDVGSHKGEKWAGERIPFLEEIIDTVPPGRKLVVEVKSDANTLPYLKQIIEQSGKADQIVIIGFDLEDMAAAKKLMPQRPVYWLKAAKKDETTEEYIPYTANLITLTKQNNLDGLNLFYEGLTEDFARQVRNAGLPLYVWTIDDPETARKIKKLAVKGITTNVPGVMKNALR